MRQKLVAGNWKMNGSKQTIEQLLDALLASAESFSAAKCAVLAPFPYLQLCQQKLDNSFIAWGAQDVSKRQAGAYTGEVAGDMLRDFGCGYVLVGHSERRQYHSETSAEVAEKFAAAVAAGLAPIACVGESLAERENGQEMQVISAQLQPLLALDVSLWDNAVLAYEPVWAIGTGKTASPQQAQEIHSYIRSKVAESYGQKLADSLQILYGGSVKPGNAQELFAEPDIDGGLVGGACLAADSFSKIGAVCKS